MSETINVSELKGSKLAEWVARANGWFVGRDDDDIDEEETLICIDEKGNVASFGEFGYRPDLNWMQGGPILVDLIAANWGLTPNGERFQCANHTSECVFYSGDWDGDFLSFDGDTVLEATMRAYVASKFGASIKL